jgi:hypothetical protein
MAQKVVVELVDDLDGTASEDISTVTFRLDGASYEIDLTENNAERLRESLAPYVGAARRTGGRIKRVTTTGPATRPTADREQTKAIREWARDNGWALADRGRIPANVMTAFDEAHATPTPKRGGKRNSQTQNVIVTSWWARLARGAGYQWRYPGQDDGPWTGRRARRLRTARRNSRSSSLLSS